MGKEFKLLKYVEGCLIPKLAKNIDESENHPEYLSRNKNLDINFPVVLKLLADVGLRVNQETCIKNISSLLILYEELRSEGQWTTEESLESSKKLNAQFEILFEINFETIFLKPSRFDTQSIYMKCMEVLNKRLLGDDFKKYPALIEVYCSLIQPVKEFDISLRPVKIFPITLHLMDDHMMPYKIKGLTCCKAILECMYVKDFNAGNYYDVIYESLKKLIFEKDLKATKLLHECFVELLRVIPKEVKKNHTDNLFSLILDQLYTESNIDRKALCFELTKNVIEVHKINCITASNFKLIVCDNLDICCIDSIAEVLLLDVLECLETWIKYCWCIWKLSSDQNLLAILFKVLYASKDSNHTLKLQQLIITLIELCSKQEQKKIRSDLQNACKTLDPHFVVKLNFIHKKIASL